MIVKLPFTILKYPRKKKNVGLPWKFNHILTTALEGERWYAVYLSILANLLTFELRQYFVGLRIINSNAITYEGTLTTDVMFLIRIFIFWNADVFTEKIWNPLQN